MQAAEQVLAEQPGVAQVAIQLSEANTHILPTNPEAITVMAQATTGTEVPRSVRARGREGEARGRRVLRRELLEGRANGSVF